MLKLCVAARGGLRGGLLRKRCQPSCFRRPFDLASLTVCSSWRAHPMTIFLRVLNASMGAAPPPCWASALATKQSSVSRSSMLSPLIVALASIASSPWG
eukprot:7874624-Pyramimonas_sp.AAC.1